MRISDWSSGVCSSDLGSFFAPFLRSEGTRHRWIGLASCPERIAQQIGMVVTSSLTIAVQQGEQRLAAAEVARDGFALHSGCQAASLARSRPFRSEAHTSELQSLMRNSYAVFCFKKKHHNIIQH